MGLMNFLSINCGETDSSNWPQYGSWMQDAVSREGEDGNKIWVTVSTDNRFESTSNARGRFAESQNDDQKC
jgi:hypothetical protein